MRDENLNFTVHTTVQYYGTFSMILKKNHVFLFAVRAVLSQTQQNCTKGVQCKQVLYE